MVPTILMNYSAFIVEDRGFSWFRLCYMFNGNAPFSLNSTVKQPSNEEAKAEVEGDFNIQLLQKSSSGG